MNRVWVFIISEKLSSEKLVAIEDAGASFVRSWTAHDKCLSARFEIFRERVIIVSVNEEVASASGCSIDKLTRFVKELEKVHGIELMNRMLVAYKKDDAVEVVPVSEISELLHNNSIGPNTIVYNTAIANQTELRQWEQALETTWLKKYLPN
jgi:hypothetical protein